MDSSCLPALLRVTTAVLELGERIAAGDLSAAAEVEAMAALLESPQVRPETSSFAT